MFRYGLWALLFWGAALLLSGCAERLQGVTVSGVFLSGGMKFGLVHSLTMIHHDFEQGQIMRARARVLAMPTEHADYARAQAFLRNHIEPARRRVFTHYLHRARRMAAKKQWSEAMWAYDQAISVTVKPDRMIARRNEMALKVRQLRLNRMIVHRRKQDRLLLADMRSYDTPHGLDPEDEIYSRIREKYSDDLNRCSTEAIREARRYLRKGLPEIAYVEIESYLRLQPDSASGVTLRKKILAAMPAGLVIPLQGKLHAGRANRVKVQENDEKNDETVTEADVQSALKAGDLIRARVLAELFHRSGGRGAEALLARVDRERKLQAASLFRTGGEAFRREQLEPAIQYWREAVALNPDEQEYAEALRRARQLQERLLLLRRQTKQAE